MLPVVVIVGLIVAFNNLAHLSENIQKISPINPLGQWLSSIQIRTDCIKLLTNYKTTRPVVELNSNFMKRLHR